jgi:hypothetical protein
MSSSLAELEPEAESEEDAAAADFEPKPEDDDVSWVICPNNQTNTSGQVYWQEVKAARCRFESDHWLKHARRNAVSTLYDK